MHNNNIKIHHFLKVSLIASFTFCAPSFLNGAAAQNELSQLKVIYEFRHVRDLTQKGAPYIADMVLSIAKNSSVYTSKYLYSMNLENKSKPQEDAQAGGQAPAGGQEREMAIGPGIGVDKYGIVEMQELYKNYTSRKFEINATLGVKLLHVESNFPTINWALQSDKRQIGGYNCQKATCNFGGRIYEAWFTTEVPYRDGPWKLSGLPGLILEAADMTGEISFRFKNLVRNTSNAEYVHTFLNSDRATKISVKDYNRLTQAYLTDPETFTLTGLPANAKIFFVNVEGGTTAKNNNYKIKRYNPIEKTL